MRCCSLLYFYGHKLTFFTSVSASLFVTCDINVFIKIDLLWMKDHLGNINNITFSVNCYFYSACFKKVVDLTCKTLNVTRIASLSKGF